jgi:hypothetical protein
MRICFDTDRCGNRASGKVARIDEKNDLVFVRVKCESGISTFAADMTNDDIEILEDPHPARKKRSKKVVKKSKKK